MILEKVQEIFRDIFDNEELTLTMETTKDDVEEWDSLATINIILALESEFGIKIVLEEAAEFNNIKYIVDLIDKKIN